MPHLITSIVERFAPIPTHNLSDPLRYNVSLHSCHSLDPADNPLPFSAHRLISTDLQEKRDKTPTKPLYLTRNRQPAPLRPFPAPKSPPLSQEIWTHHVDTAGPSPRRRHLISSSRRARSQNQRRRFRKQTNNTSFGVLSIWFKGHSFWPLRPILAKHAKVVCD